MKKIISFLLAFTMVLSVSMIAGCNNPESNEPQYETAYSYDDTYHWRNEIGGTGYTDYSKHRDEGGMCVCGMYYDATDFLEFRRLEPSEGLGTGYAVSRFKGDEYGAYVHVEIPTHFQDLEDDEPLPVLKLDNYLFSIPDNPGIVSIESIKLNDGLKYIGTACFNGTMLTEIVIPDSVTGRIYNTFGGSMFLKRVVIGNGITTIYAYTFYDCPALEEVILGESVKEIKHRAFGLTPELKSIVFPKSLVSLPEYSIYATSTKTHVTINQAASFKDVYFNITEDEYNELIIPDLPRDSHGAVLVNGIPHDPDPSQKCPDCTANNRPAFSGWTTYGYHASWNSSHANLHFKGTWHYDENGKPVAN